MSLSDNRSRFVDTDTGKPPTDAEWEEMIEAAQQILTSWQYSSPEKVEWAMMVDPSFAETIHG